MNTSRVLIPTIALSALALTGCTSVDGGSSNSSAAASSPLTSGSPAATSAAPATTSAAPETSTQAPAESSAPAASSAPATAASSAPGGSSQPTSTVKLTESDILGFAASHEVRSCTSANVGYVSSTRFCKEDATAIEARYKGESLNFTTAVQFKAGATYTYEVSNGTQTKKGQLNATGSARDNGKAVTLDVRVPMQTSGTYSIKYFENGAQLGSDTVQVTVK